MKELKPAGDIMLYGLILTHFQVIVERIMKHFSVGHGSEIVGGREVKAHSLPYMALVQNSKYICGGTLIHPKWVLTAAHCEK